MNTAVYAGTFDPITRGHLTVIQQASRLFSHVRVLVAINPKQTLFTNDERVDLIQEAIRRYPNASVDACEGLVVAYAREIGATVLVRGIRGATDAAFETDLAHTNRKLAPEIATVLIPAEPGLAEVSSSGLKDLLRRNEDVSSYCLPFVESLLRSKLGLPPAEPEGAP